MITGIEKVIFDTNSINSDGSAENFLGGRNELEKFKKVAEIIIPYLAIEEIKQRKKEHLKKKKDSFLGNIFHKLRGVSENETKEFDIDDFVKKLEEGETISYAVITLTDFTVLPKMIRLAVERKPPFEEGSDKGFKDAYIYFTVLEFLKNNLELKVYFVTKDNKLKDAFVSEPRVKVVKDFDDFQRYRMTYFTDEYFLTKLTEKLGEEISAENISDAWLNTNSNWVIEVTVDGISYRVEVDFSTREIIDFMTPDMTGGIQALVDSGSFASTHTTITDLKGKEQYFSDDEILQLFVGATENNQIYWLAEDDDVKNFYLPLYEAKKNLLPEEIRGVFKTYFSVKE